MALTSLLLRFTHTAAILWQHQKETALLQVRMYCLSWLVIGTSVYLTPPFKYSVLFSPANLLYLLFYLLNALWVLSYSTGKTHIFSGFTYNLWRIAFFPHATCLSHKNFVERPSSKLFFSQSKWELFWGAAMTWNPSNSGWAACQRLVPSARSQPGFRMSCPVLQVSWKSHKLSWALCQQRILDYPHDCPLQGSINHNIMPWQNYGRWWRSILEHPGHLLSPQSNALTLQFCVPNHKIEAIILIFQDWYEA